MPTLTVPSTSNRNKNHIRLLIISLIIIGAIWLVADNYSFDDDGNIRHNSNCLEWRVVWQDAAGNQGMHEGGFTDKDTAKKAADRWQEVEVDTYRHTEEEKSNYKTYSVKCIRWRK